MIWRPSPSPRYQRGRRWRFALREEVWVQRIDGSWQLWGRTLTPLGRRVRSAAVTCVEVAVILAGLVALLALGIALDLQ